jgi:N-acetyl-gamma-glutamyl-phosphate reductase
MELVRLLSQHPQVELVHFGSRTYADTPLTSGIGSFRGFFESVVCKENEAKELADQCDVLFLALPHGIASRQITREVLEKCCIIDLGADFRLKDRKVYEQWYGVEHGSPELLEEAVYGLPELSRKGIRDTNLIANPGCYTTCSILGLAPLVEEGILPRASLDGTRTPIIVDAKSGVSGAGRKASQELHFAEANESIKAYKIGSHRHTPEIEAALWGILKNHKGTDHPESLQVQFTPHLIPMNRGILVTAYINPGKDFASTHGTADLRGLYEKRYEGERFVRILPPGIVPETRWVKGSNFIDISVNLDQRTGTIIVVAAIDNLIKGAAGQAVQNMNIRFGFPEERAIDMAPFFP